MADIRKKADPKVVYQKIEKCGGMQNDTNHAIGTRVMLRWDTNVAKRLVSGYMRTFGSFALVRPLTVCFGTDSSQSRTVVNSEC
jgi:hypothetical protein